MSNKAIEPNTMIQQRKHAWIERKKKPKREMSPSKVGLNSGRVFSSYPAKNCYKVSTYRHHEASKVPYSDVTYNNISTRGSSGNKKMSLSQSQFLPPILAISGDSNLSLPHRQSSDGTSTREVVNTDIWRLQINGKTLDKDLPQCASQKDVASELYFGGRPSQTLQLVPSCWDQKTIALRETEDQSKPPLKSSPSPDLYRSCLLVITPRKPDRESSAQHTTGREVVTGGTRTQRRTVNKCIPAWRNYGFHQATKAEDKLSSKDSAFGTDSSCETSGIVLELGLEMFKAEMNQFTQQRIIDWILEVNDALFSSHSKEPSKCSLTEQDTSIKFVYEGDE